MTLKSTVFIYIYGLWYNHNMHTYVHESYSFMFFKRVVVRQKQNRDDFNFFFEVEGNLCNFTKIMSL